MEVDEEKEAYPVLSLDGKMEAYIEGYNVVVHEAHTLGGTPWCILINILIYQLRLDN